MTPFPWPEGFDRVPADDWTTQPVESLALKYDKVENHGWYRNLDLTVEHLDRALRSNDILIDYSGGTGILADRLLQSVGKRRVGICIVDSSPKFLRLAVEKFRDEPRLAFRLIRYLKERRRLELLDEVAGALALRGADALVSTNAIHLYYDLGDTLRSWKRVLKPGAKVFVQSGNLQNPSMGPGDWIIDDTVAAIHRVACHLAETAPEFAAFRPALADADRLEACAELRRKIFLPSRPLDYYLVQFAEAGFEPLETTHRRIEARVEEWYEFLSVYHDGVLGWAGPTERIDRVAPTGEQVALRLKLMRRAMEDLFGGREAFHTCWTYLTLRA